MLTEAVRRRPYLVILLDEIEKAHPTCSNVLLQVLDDGRMTDGKGRTVDFKNTILIMTSNLGQPHHHGTGPDRSGRPCAARWTTSCTVSSSRSSSTCIDEIITFHGLTREDLAAIVDIQIRRMARRLAERKYKVTLTKEAKQFLVDTGYDPSFGARPLKRAIQRHIEDPLALEILEGRFAEGDRILIDRAPAGGLAFSKQ